MKPHEHFLTHSYKNKQRATNLSKDSIDIITSSNLSLQKKIINQPSASTPSPKNITNRTLESSQSSQKLLTRVTIEGTGQLTYLLENPSSRSVLKELKIQIPITHKNKNTFNALFKLLPNLHDLNIKNLDAKNTLESGIIDLSHLDSLTYLAIERIESPFEIITAPNLMILNCNKINGGTLDASHSNNLNKVTVSAINSGTLITPKTLKEFSCEIFLNGTLDFSRSTSLSKLTLPDTGDKIIFPPNIKNLTLKEIRRLAHKKEYDIDLSNLTSLTNLTIHNFKHGRLIGPPNLKKITAENIGKKQTQPFCPALEPKTILDLSQSETLETLQITSLNICCFLDTGEVRLPQNLTNLKSVIIGPEKKFDLSQILIGPKLPKNSPSQTLILPNTNQELLLPHSSNTDNIICQNIGPNATLHLRHVETISIQANLQGKIIFDPHRYYNNFKKLSIQGKNQGQITFSKSNFPLKTYLKLLYQTSKPFRLTIITLFLIPTIALLKFILFHT